MNPQDDAELQRQLQKLEAELEHSQPVKLDREPTRDNASLTTQITTWFRGLPQGGKILVVSIAALVSLSVVSAVLRLLFLSIQLAFVGGVLYLIYKIFFAPKSPER